MLVIQSTFFVTTFRTLSTVSAAPYFWYHNEKTTNLREDVSQWLKQAGHLTYHVNVIKIK